MDFLFIGGENRPFRASWKQLKAIAAKKGFKKLAELGEVLSDLTLDEVPFFVHLCLQAGAKKAGSDFNYSIEDVEDWVDEDMSVVMEAFQKVADNLSGGGKPKAVATPPKESQGKKP
jgi:hypothetical protein